MREGIFENNGKKNKETSVYRLCPRLNTKELCLANGFNIVYYSSVNLFSFDSNQGCVLNVVFFS